MIKKATTLDLTARTLGFNMTFQYIGMFLGSVLGGQIGDFIGIKYIFFITSTLLFINAIIIYSKIYKNPIKL